MKTKSLAGWATLLCALFACSGRYDVGGAGPQPVSAAGASDGGDVVSPGGSSAGGAAAAGGVAGSRAVAGESPAGDACDQEAAPPPLDGELADPSLVWERVTRLVEGEGQSPPFPLPSSSSHAWVDELVSRAFLRARATGAADGARAVVGAWLYRDVEPADELLEVDWGQLLIAAEPALEQLMREPVGEHGYGVFSEPSWLRRFPSISQRGVGILGRVFGIEAPLPPAGVDLSTPEVDGLTRRQELAAEISPTVCRACHAAFDPLGFPYGVFDEQGDYHELDDGHPIDTSGTLPIALEELSFADMSELGEQVVSSCAARRGFVKSFARAALALEGVPREEAETQVGLHAERLERAFVSSPARSYEDAVRAFAQSPLVLQR